MGLKGVAQKGKGVADKGKAVADKASPAGKRKRSDDGKKSGRSRQRNSPGVLRFFEDDADVAHDSDSSDISDYFRDFMEEDFGLGENDNNEAGKSSSIPFIPKEEEMDEEEFGRMMGDGYNDSSQFASYAEDGHENKRSTDRSSRISSDDEPIIWKVKCAVGRERVLSFCLMQKYVDLKSLGKKLEIISAFALDHVKGFLFIESDKQSNVNEACYGLPGVYATRVMPVPRNEVSRLVSIKPPRNEISVGMWARVKNGKYKGDLAQVVHVSKPPKRVVVKLIPRIDLQAMAEKYGGGATAKKISNPAPRLINSSELEEFRPLIQTKKDRDTGKIVQVLDGMMIKDGYLYKKVAIDSISCSGVEPSEEEQMKFSTSENNESDNSEWLSQLYGEQKKKRSIRKDALHDKGVSSGSVAGGKGESSGSVTGGKGESSGSIAGGKGESSGSMAGGKGECSESTAMNSFEVHDLVCVGRRDFGVVIGIEKDYSYKILKEGKEGPSVVTVQQSELQNEPSDMKFTALDHRLKTISVSDTVKVIEGPLEGKQGIVKKIYRGIVFMYDENETENCGYFCCKSRICERVKLSPSPFNEKGGESSFPCFDDFPASPKSPLSPKKPWQSRDDNRNFNQADKDGMFNIGQTLRIRIGPLKGYLCRVIAIRRSDVTVKLDSKQKILTVKSEHLSEVRGSSSVVSSEGPESSFLKPFDLFGGEGLSTDWADGAGASGAGDGWTSGAVSSERSSWPNLSTPGSSMQWESGGANQAGAENDVNKDVEGAWGSKVTPKTNDPWGAQAADKDDAGWGRKSTEKATGGSGGVDGNASNIWNKDSSENAGCSWGQDKSKVGILGDSSNDASASWEKNINVHDNQDCGKAVEEPWDKGKNIADNSAGSWGAATTKKNELDSWGKSKSVAEGGSWEKKNDCAGEDGLSKTDSTWSQQKSWDTGKDKVSNDSSAWGNKTSFPDKNNSGNFGSSDNDGSRDLSWGKKGAWNSESDSLGGNQDAGWGKKSGWNTAASDTDGKQDSNWGKKGDCSAGLGGSEGNRDSNLGKKSDWNSGSGDSRGNVDSGLGSKSSWHSKSCDVDGSRDSNWGKKSDWNSGSSGTCGNKESGWGTKSNLNSESGGTSENQDSVWGKKSNWNSESDGVSGNQDSGGANGNQDSAWGKKSNWNSESGGTDGNQDSGWGKKSNWNSDSGGTSGNQDSGWGKKSNWNSDSGGASGNQDSAWGKKSNQNSEFGNGNSNWGSGDNQTEEFNSKPSGGNWRGGRGGDRGGYRGRGGYGGRGGDRGGFGGRGGDRGGFGGRGRSDRGGFGGRGGSDRGGFGGRGRGRRDQNGGWNNRDSGGNDSSWNKGSESSAEGGKNSDGAGAWNQGSDYKNKWQDGTSGSAETGNVSCAWNQSVEGKDGGSWDKGTSSSTGGGGSWGDNGKPSGAFGGAQWSSSSNTNQEGGWKGSQAGGWNKGSNQSTEAGGNWGSEGKSSAASAAGRWPGSTNTNQEGGWKGSSSEAGNWNEGTGSSTGGDGDWRNDGKPSVAASGGGAQCPATTTSNKEGGWNGSISQDGSWNKGNNLSSGSWGKKENPAGASEGAERTSSAITNQKGGWEGQNSQAGSWGNNVKPSGGSGEGQWSCSNTSNQGGVFKVPSSTAQAGSWSNQGSYSNAARGGWNTQSSAADAKDKTDASESTDAWGKPPSKSWGSGGNGGGGFKVPSSTAQAGSWNNQGSDSNAARGGWNTQPSAADAKVKTDASGSTDAWGKPPSKSWGSGGNSGGGFKVPSSTAQAGSWNNQGSDSNAARGGWNTQPSAADAKVKTDASGSTDAWGKPPSKSWGSGGNSGGGFKVPSSTAQAGSWNNQGSDSNAAKGGWNSQPSAAESKDRADTSGSTDTWGKPPSISLGSGGGGFKEPSSTAQAGSWNNQGSDSNAARGGWNTQPSAVDAKDGTDTSGSTDAWGKPPAKSWGSGGSSGGKGGW